MTDDESTEHSTDGWDRNAILDRLDTLIQHNQSIEDRLRSSGDNRRIHDKIADADMPFFSLVGLLVKIALASIPAMIIVAAIMFGLIVLGIVIIGAMGIGAGAVNSLNDQFDVSRFATTPTYSFVVPPRATRMAPATPIPNFGPLDMFDISSRAEQSEFIVEGQVVNRGTTDLENSSVIVTIYIEGEDQRQKGAKLNSLLLSPGDVSSFSVSIPLSEQGNNVTGFMVDFVDASGRPIPFRDTAP